MRAVVQRVLCASVEVDGAVVGSCGFGLLVLVGAHKNDTDENAKKLADRIAGLRVFNDSEGKMNLSLADADRGHVSADEATRGEGLVGGEEQSNVPRSGVLAVSNFTVFGDALKSRRPSFVEAAGYGEGERLFAEFVAALRALGVSTETGVFGADMKVSLVNDGPVTLIVDC